MILPTRPPAWRPEQAGPADLLWLGGLPRGRRGPLLETTIYHPAPSTLALRLAQPDTQVVYSEEFRNPCALYTTEDGSRYKVWYENEQSVLDKVALARMFGITGVSLWRIGNIPADGAYDVWSALLTQR